MPQVAHTFEDIPLGNAQVLKEMPRGVEALWRFRVEVFARKRRGRFIEGHMGVAALKERNRCIEKHIRE